MEDQPNQSLFNAMSLSDLLDKIESNLSRLGAGMAVDPKEILDEMDEASIRINKAATQGHATAAEEAQFDYTGKILQNMAPLFIRTVGGSGALRKLRDQFKPPADNWWWFIDQWLQHKQSASLRKTALLVGSGVILLIVVVFVYQLFLAPDKATQLKYSSIDNAQQAMGSGDYAAALVQINQALANSPNDADLLIYKSVLLAKLGQPGEAEKVFAQADKILHNHDTLLATRTLDYLQAGDAKSAKASAQELITYNPKSAEGYFYLAKSEELLGDQNTALDNYNIAFNLADAQGNAELSATIKISMAMMMQSMNSQLPTMEFTPTVPAK